MQDLAMCMDEGEAIRVNFWQGRGLCTVHISHREDGTSYVEVEICGGETQVIEVKDYCETINTHKEQKYK